ncbi:hypothetical protein MTR67_026644 [Solanum verrucosum]|uniref:Bulb-type lectin domain-containing protein n=1 Tax=Solanum verrucosum TaxID=315347 RepID=A0AAF0R837_SOLVR|nr:hypothetical protein MTR67_026644 [Solanum verrucosum]
MHVLRFPHGSRIEIQWDSGGSQPTSLGLDIRSLAPQTKGRGYDTWVDFINIGMVNFDVILGLDRLSPHHVIFYFNAKTVAMPGVLRVKWKGVSSCYPSKVIYFVCAQRLEDHVRHLSIVLRRLREEKLYAKFSKCEFCLDSVAFLGHMVFKEGIKVDLSWIEAVRELSNAQDPIDLDFYFESTQGRHGFTMYSNASGVGLGGVLIVIWSSDSTRHGQNQVAQLLDSGNLVVRDAAEDKPQNYLWQSFDNPGETTLPGMKVGINLKTNFHRSLSSWKSTNDPSIGEFTWTFDTGGFLQTFIMNDFIELYRAGLWNV